MLLGAAFLGGACGLFACSEGDGDPMVTGSLFQDLDGQYKENILAHRDRRKGGDSRFTKLPGQVEWAPDLPTAIERAKEQDKPIFMLTFVRENGDPHCDV
jgi:hypothetical protein